MASTIWTGALVARLKKLWMAGHTGTEIAADAEFIAAQNGHRRRLPGGKFVTIGRFGVLAKARALNLAHRSPGRRKTLA